MEMVQHEDNSVPGRIHITDGTPCWCNPEVIQVPPAEPQTVEVNVVMGAQLRAIVRSALIHVRNAVKGSSRIEDDSQIIAVEIIDEELEKWPLSADPEDTLAQWLWNRFGKAKDWEQLGDNTKAYWEHEAAAVRRAVGRGGFKTSPDETIDPDLPTAALNHVHEITGGEVKGFRQLGLKHAESIGEAIRIAVGAASTCWTKMDNTGVFKSTEALDISTQLEHHIMDFIQTSIGQIGERHQALYKHLKMYHDDGQPMVSVAQVMELLTGRTTPVEYESAMQRNPEVGGHGRG